MNTFYENSDAAAYYQKEDYGVLIKTLETCRNVPGLGCEIGVREGHGSFCMMKFSPLGRTHVSVDPYGNIAYRSWETRCDHLNNYTNNMFYTTMQRLYAAADRLQRHLIFFPLEDTEFMNRFSLSVPIYRDNEKTFERRYAIVHIDGPHTLDDVMRETEFFVMRMNRGGCIVFDDINQYPHFPKVDDFMTANGFRVLFQSEKKISYIRK